MTVRDLNASPDLPAYHTICRLWRIKGGWRAFLKEMGYPELGRFGPRPPDA